MQKITLYRYVRPDGGVTISTAKPDADYTELSRLIADEGMILTDGENQTPCVDTDTPDAWYELVDTESDLNEATAEDYESALSEFGVEV